MKTILLVIALRLCAVPAVVGQQALALHKEKNAAPVETAPTQTLAAASDFHQMLARSNGAWTGQATMTFAPGAPPLTSTSTLTNTMAMGGLYQVSEVKWVDRGKPMTGIRVTGYDAVKKVFTRAMIQDGGNGVAMEGPWDEASHSITMRYRQFSAGKGREEEMKEVYTIVDENTEVLEIYRLEPAQADVKILHVKWTRNK